MHISSPTTPPPVAPPENGVSFTQTPAPQSPPVTTIPPPAPTSTTERKPQEPHAHHGQVTLSSVLHAALRAEASDIHFSEGEKIAFRIYGSIRFIEEIPELSHDIAKDFLFSMIQNEEHKKKYMETKELDFAYEHEDGTNFRVNAFFKRGKIAVVMRVVPSKVHTIEALGLPQAVIDLIQKKQGIILVTGPTGSGKSTSMQSMLEHINLERVEHILTIEDPIEFLFHSKKSIFSQREIGRDTHSFSNALRAALREDPDIVMIGEMRDAETISTAMHLAETGHLVISTLHTSSAPQTVSRLVSSFPPSEQSQVQSRLADSLIGVLSQRLVQKKGGDGRVGIYELMIVDSAIRNLVRNNEVSQIYNAMMAGRSQGMVTMQGYAEALAEKGIIEEKDFLNFFRVE